MSIPNKPEANSISGLIASLQAEAGLGKPRSLPPVHLWNPANCGDIGLEIRRDGGWLQNGDPFTRQSLVRLFSTILRRDPDGYFLVTPHEKVKVKVEDAPFVGVRIDLATGDDGPVLLLTTNVGDVVAIGPDHPLRVVEDQDSAQPSAYVLVRGGLEARLLRPPWYELARLAELEETTGQMTIRSSGRTFLLGRAE